MDFFNSLSLDVKLLLAGIVGCSLLALFSGNHRAEKRYMVVLALLAAVGVYRFKVTSDEQAAAAAKTSATVVKSAPTHVPLVSTSSK